MKFTVIECEQRSPEWYQARSGLLTGSRAHDMLTKIKSGEAAARRDLRVQLVCERITGRSQDEDSYKSKDMQRGADLEQRARAVYEAETGVVVQTTGFIRADELMAGCSLDGHVGQFEGVVDFKCPKAATHLKYMLDRRIPTDYVDQLRHNAWITGAQWADFVSFDPRFPDDLQFLCIRVYREELELEAYEREAVRFLAEVDVAVTQLETWRAKRAAA